MKAQAVHVERARSRAGRFPVLSHVTLFHPGGHVPASCIHCGCAVDLSTLRDRCPARVRVRSLLQLLGPRFGIEPGIAVPFDSMPIVRVGWRCVSWNGDHALCEGVRVNADGEWAELRRDDGYRMEKPRDSWALVIEVRGRFA